MNRYGLRPHAETHMDGGADSIPGGAIPSGVICMWSGTLATISSGWLLCDGTSGTPNLLAHFIKGVATNVTDPGATGGAATHTPTGTVSQPTFSGSALSTHQHELPYQKVAGGLGVFRMLPAATYGLGSSIAAESVSVAPSIDVTAAPVELSQAIGGGTPAGTVSQPTFTGNSQNTEPVFYALAFIMKS